MNSTPNHNTLIKTIAKQHLAPHGFVQKGQSRVFLKDHGWYAVVIEFQASSWSKGSYLNVGVDFHFYPRDYFTLGYNARQNEFLAFSNAEEFTTGLNDFCRKALAAASTLISELSSSNTAVQFLSKHQASESWAPYELAFLHALSGNTAEALHLFTSICSAECQSDWELKRLALSERLCDALRNNPDYLEVFLSVLKETRALKKLPALDPLPLPSAANVSAKMQWWKKLFTTKILQSNTTSIKHKR